MTTYSLNGATDPLDTLEGWQAVCHGPLVLSSEKNGTTEYATNCILHPPDNNPSMIVVVTPHNKRRPVRVFCRHGATMKEFVALARQRLQELDAEAGTWVPAAPEKWPYTTLPRTAAATTDERPFDPTPLKGSTPSGPSAEPSPLSAGDEEYAAWQRAGQQIDDDPAAEGVADGQSDNVLTFPTAGDASGGSSGGSSGGGGSNGRHPPPGDDSGSGSKQRGDERSGSAGAEAQADWWARHTALPGDEAGMQEFLAERGIGVGSDGLWVSFPCWDAVGPQPGPVAKGRKVGSKEFRWHNAPNPAPPLLLVRTQEDAARTELPPCLYLTEGEGDADALARIVAHDQGILVGSLSAGAGTPLSPELLADLYARGMRTLVLFPDRDDEGEGSVRRLLEAAEQLPPDIDLAVGIADLGLIVPNHLAGGYKDIRDFRAHWGTLDAARPAIARLVADAHPRVRSTQAPLVSGEQILALRSYVSVMRRWLYRDTLAEIVADEFSYKTFLALEIALDIAAGLPCFGYRTVGPEDVVYIYAEGQSGLSKRVRAWCIERGQPIPPRFHGYPGAVNLRDEDAVTRFLRRITTMAPRPALVVVDTLSQCFGGGNENASEDMGAAYAAVAAIQQRTGANVLTLRHGSKAAHTDGRGHSSFSFNIHTRITLERQGDRVLVHCKKQKDHDPFPDLTLECKVVPLGTFDEDGDEETSLVLLPRTSATGAHGAAPPLRLTPAHHTLLTVLAHHKRGTNSTVWWQGCGDAALVERLSGTHPLGLRLPRVGRSKHFKLRPELLAHGLVHEDSSNLWTITDQGQTALRTITV